MKDAASQNTDSTGTMRASSNTTIAHVNVKLPPIWPKNMKIWFRRIEAQFSTANISKEITKFNHLVASLDCDVAELVSDFLSKPLRHRTPI